MFIFQVYDDGSYSTGYERGDIVYSQDDLINYSLNGDEVSRVKAGTPMTIKGNYGTEVLQTVISSFWVKELYSPHLAGRFYAPITMETKLCPPIIYYVDWHEGNLWKHSRVVEWSPEGALWKLQKYLIRYGKPRFRDMTFGDIHTEKPDTAYISTLRI